jgi:hypothetical protein
MVRNLLLILILNLLSSCYFRNQHDIIRANSISIKPVENFNDINIDENAIYSYYATFYKTDNGIEHYRIMYGLIDSVSSPLLRFYSEGKVSLFNHSSLPFSHNFFNPKDSYMGYYGKNKNNELIMKILFKGDGNGYIEKSKFYIYNDSIVEINVIDNWGSVYKKIDVPKEYLDGWKPDW